MLGENILKLRKKLGLSQEQLGEKVGVTRQTISNWELNETSPNPEQLKLLSKALKVSIDELLNNGVQNILVEKVSNTEKLAGIIIKILKVLGILFIIYIVFLVIAILSYSVIDRDIVTNTEEIELQCQIAESDYIINVATDGYFNCSNCPKELQKTLKNNYLDFSDLSQTAENIEDYFKTKNGTCEETP